MARILRLPANQRSRVLLQLLRQDLAYHWDVYALLLNYRIRDHLHHCPSISTYSSASVFRLCHLYQ